MSEDLGTMRSADDLRTLVTTVRGALGSEPAVVALAAQIGERPAVIVGVNRYRLPEEAELDILEVDNARVRKRAES